MALHIIDHPLVQHKLSIMRKKETSTMKFRDLLKEIAMFMGYEVTRDFPCHSSRLNRGRDQVESARLRGSRCDF